MIGQLGDYEFEVSAESVKTFDGLKLSEGASWTEHKVLGRKGLLEFTGLNAGSLSLKISLNENLGVDPLTELEAFREYMTEGAAVIFMLGEEVIGSDYWVIESLDEEYSEIGSKGQVKRIDVNLKLKEYIDDE